MIVVGIDPGLATTGYGFIQKTISGDFVAIDYGVVTTSARMPTEQRLLYIYQEIRKLILLHRPQSAAVEKLFFSNNAKTVMGVSQARGVLLLALAEAKLNVFEYSPLEVKIAVTGYGGAEKKQMQQMIQVLLKTPKMPQPDDAADALAVAVCHANNNYINLFLEQA